MPVNREHPDTAAGDVAYWRLSHAQAAHHYARLARMHADTAACLATGARRFYRWAAAVLWVWAAALVLILAAQIARTT